MATQPIPATSGFLVRGRHVALSAVYSDYWKLTKPDVNFLIAFTTAASFIVSASTSSSGVAWTVLLHTVIGTLLVASGAAALNQWMERGLDARMRRTARRPIAAGRIEPGHALWFGITVSVAGAAYLAINSTLLSSFLACVTLLSYLLVYTPLKRVTPLCTAVGAIPGALPTLIGFAAVGGHLEPEALVLFAIVFLWQFPHFMAIAWMYRDDYDRAGYLVLPRGHVRVRFVQWQTMLPLLLLVIISLLPVVLGRSSPLYGVAAFCLDAAFVYYGAQFAFRRSALSARRLLLSSILYLPPLFLLLMFA